MNEEYARSRLSQLDKKIHQMEAELRQVKKDRVALKNECVKHGKRK